MTSRLTYRFTVLSSLVVFFVLACSSAPVTTPVDTDDPSLTAENRRLYELLSETDSSNRSVLVRSLVDNLIRADMPLRAVHLLTTQVSKHPDDPYNSLYLFMAGRIYESTDSPDLAVPLFRRAVNSFPDVAINGGQVHQRALETLGRIMTNAADRIVYLERYLEEFPQHANNGTTHYAMARTYESLGKWEQSLDAYRRFLTFPETEIPGRPNVHREVSHMLQFARSNRGWTRPTLDGLVREITLALRQQNARALYALQSGVNFFTASRSLDPLDANSTFGFDIQVFLSQSNVRVASSFEVNSNEREAFLRTDGWYDRMSTWYLYFRRIDFPSDPSVHGNWEWAGIRFGEVL